MGDLLEFTFDSKLDFKWTNRGDAYAHVIGQMYENEEQFDLIIKVNGGQLPAHRHVMAIVSPTIKKMLEKTLNPEKSFVTHVSEGKFCVRWHMNRYKI